MVAWSLSSGVAMWVDTCGLATSCCKMHCDGCLNVAWGLCWGGSRSTKPGVFPCKVVAAGDERYLLRAAVAAGVVSCANWFLLCVLQVSVCVVLCVSWICRCRSHWNGCRNCAFFRVKWPQAAMKGTLCVRRLRFGSLQGESIVLQRVDAHRSEWLFPKFGFFSFQNFIFQMFSFQNLIFQILSFQNLNFS